MGSDSEFWGEGLWVRGPHAASGQKLDLDLDPTNSICQLWGKRHQQRPLWVNFVQWRGFNQLVILFGAQSFFCWESRNIEQWITLTWDSTLWLANKLNHFYEIIFIGSKPFIINHSHGIYDFWTCIRWQLKSRRTQVEVIFLENTTIFAAIVWNNAVCLLVFGLYRALYNFCSS